MPPTGPSPVGQSGGAVGVAGTMSPSGDFGIGVVTDGSAVKDYRFYKIAIPGGADSLLFTDVIDWEPLYGGSGAGPGPLLGLTISEDGRELWYTAPVQNHPSYFGCVLKRYSLATRQFVSVDVLPASGGVTARTPTSFAWQGGAARVAGPRVSP